MKKKNGWLLAIIIILILLTLFITLAKIPAYNCACSTAGYTFYPLVSALINHVQACPPSLPYAGCTLSHYIIPEDLIFLILVLLAIYLYQKLRKA